MISARLLIESDIFVHFLFLLMGANIAVFNILSLSGGGYLGLYTASVLAKLEEELVRPIIDSFDLIAGTSIGGIIALGLAAGKRPEKIQRTFRDRGHEIFSKKRPPKSVPGKIASLFSNALRPKYRSEKLRNIVDDILGKELLIGDLQKRIIVPAVNVTKGRPQVFKTPHHPTFTRDKRLGAADVAMATSAAPTFFQMHSIEGERFIDGGVYANAPDLLALHEAEHFLGIPNREIRMLSIGTTTANFSLSSATDSDLGSLCWMKEQRLISVVMGAQQLNSNAMLKHRLGDRFVRIDHELSKEQMGEMALDVASEEATTDLIGLAEASVREFSAKPELKQILASQSPKFGRD